METFTPKKELVSNPEYEKQKTANLGTLDLNAVDPPIMELIKDFNTIPYCFTLQCCYGHFVYPGQNDIHNLAPLPTTDHPASIEYRIAYIAFCVQNSPAGKLLLEDMEAIAANNPQYIQFGCADWFWKRQVNSYAIQLEPEDQMFSDTAGMSYQQALKIQQIRGGFFARIEEVVQKHTKQI